ncbi:MAG: hypothetical protein JBO36_15245 [Candidatus Thiodiazotropha taylori]|nr:hypothetical protein [Candidatus Thiodiazotropha taylori]
MIAWVVFILLVFLAGAGANKLFSSSLVACVVSSFISTFVFQLIVAVQIGHLDKFALIAVAVMFPVAFFISGIEIIILRKWKKTKE